MKKIAYVIGHRNSSDSCRVRNLSIVFKWLSSLRLLLLKHNIKLIIVVIEQDDKPKLKEICTDDITYIFVYNPELYNRGWAFNVAFKEVEADYYFFADNDIILQNDDMIYVFTRCFKYDAVNPYFKLYDSEEQYINDNFDPCMCDPKLLTTFSERSNTCFSGGIVGLSEKSINIVAGWDERFRGRGWEDYAFTTKIKLFLYSLHTFKFVGLHLWHKPEEQTTREINCELNKEYQTYDVCDYLNIIKKSYDFGSSTKYATFGKKTVYKSHEFKHKKRIKHAYKVFDETYKRISKKHKVSKNQKLSLVYHYLCDQYQGCDPLASDQQDSSFIG